MSAAQKILEESGDIMAQAEQYAESKAEEAKEEQRRRKKLLIKLGIMMTLTVLILVLTTIAWFASNVSTTAGGMAVTAGGATFSLATKEQYISYEDVLKSADSTYDSGTEKTLTDENGDDGTFYISGGSLILHCVDQSDEDEQAHGNKDIQPGEWDKFNLYIVPAEAGDLTANITLEVIPFATLEVYNSDGTPKYVLGENGEPVTVNGKYVHETELVRITTRAEFVAKAQELHNTKAENDADEYLASAEYIKGHIMFFGGANNNLDEEDPESFYFTDPYTDGTLTFTGTALETDHAYEIPLYWMWPNTLGQIALPSADGRKGPAVVSDSDSTEKAALVDYLKDNKSKVFANLGTLYEGKTDSEINDAIDSVAATPSDSANFKKLSEGYNKADFHIGTYISYFAVEINVDKQA
ncbi:MAG: hypothetical protein IKP47_11460 [Ruminococcus sp.]|nr:hypothetical protein [Ruminococcus sp.]